MLPLRRPDGAPIAARVTVRRAIAIAEAVFARDGALPPVERLEWLALELEDFLARAGARSRFFLSLMIGLVSFLSPVFIGRGPGVMRLALCDRIRALTTLERRFGEPLIAVKALLCLLYYEHPDAARGVGFDGKCRLPTRGPASP